MPDDAPKAVLKIGLYTGPTLRADPAADLGATIPICVDCPAAWWHKRDGKYECFCTQFRSIMFGRREPAVTACDARADAIEDEPKKASGG